MSDLTSFKRRHCEADIILCAVRWHLWYALNDRDVEELRRERSVWVDHATVFLRVQRDAPELAQQWRPQFNATNDSYCVDEAYTRIKKHWHYLYRAVASVGATFRLHAECHPRDADAAGQCFRKVLGVSHRPSTRLSRVDVLAYVGTLVDGCPWVERRSPKSMRPAMRR
jgi:transposase-like protein